MVQTRAQSKTTGKSKAAEHEPAGLKAPARRGRAKKTEPEKPEKPEKKPTTTRKTTRQAPVEADPPAKKPTTTRRAATTQKAASAPKPTAVQKAALSTQKKTTVGRRAGRKIVKQVKEPVEKPVEEPVQVLEGPVETPAEVPAVQEPVKAPIKPAPTVEAEVNASEAAVEQATENASRTSNLPKPVASPQRPPTREREPLAEITLPPASINEERTTPSPKLPAAITATSSHLKSSVLVAGNSTTLGSPKKPPITPKLLLSPAKSRSGFSKSVPKPTTPFKFQEVQTTSNQASPEFPHDPFSAPFPSITASPPKRWASPPKSSLRRIASTDVLTAPSSTLTGSPQKSCLRRIVSSEVLTTSFSNQSIEQPQTSPKKTVSFRTSQAPTEIPECRILDGVRIYVDVRCANGEDGSAAFESLLTELGADVVDSWTTNVNRSPGKVSEIQELTHVLWANGNTMTLEKVLATNGAVKCVNLSWPLE
jgi:hypothetical protein